MLSALLLYQKLWEKYQALDKNIEVLSGESKKPFTLRILFKRTVPNITCTLFRNGKQVKGKKVQITVGPDMASITLKKPKRRQSGFYEIKLENENISDTLVYWFSFYDCYYKKVDFFSHMKKPKDYWDFLNKHEILTIEKECQCNNEMKDPVKLEEGDCPEILPTCPLVDDIECNPEVEATFEHDSGLGALLPELKEDTQNEHGPVYPLTNHLMSECALVEDSGPKSGDSSNINAPAGVLMDNNSVESKDDAGISNASSTAGTWLFFDTLPRVIREMLNGPFSESVKKECLGIIGKEVILQLLTEFENNI